MEDWTVFMDEFDKPEEEYQTTSGEITSYKIREGQAPIDISLEENIVFDLDDKSSECYKCGGKLCRKKDIVICQGCGIELNNEVNITEEEYSASAITECNVHADGFISVKMVGKNSYGYQRSLLKTCASYSKYRKQNTFKDMNNWNVHSKKHHIPKYVIREANDMFAVIKEHGYVYRKDGKKGVLSACLYYACYNNGISKTPGEIANFSGIEEKFQSQGDRVLRDLNEKNIIDIPVDVDPIGDYLDRYLKLLEIHKNYKPFLHDLINRAEKNRIHVLHDSKNNTKCAGVIYMLTDRIPELKKRINKDDIEAKCEISKTTFTRYYKVLCSFYRKIKKSFKKYKIPMKREWKD